ncbi:MULTISPECIES: hypothetical protein [Bacteroidales]|jgi:cell division GTPase FtsZ|uniref:hypothetical protein n=1 Tax=Bacteroidales TaxID=171549 RepID=UPI000F51A571|nr:hypothetical protein [Sangeribacter muris]MBJ2192004.1 hypothetical protein [Muribaculaceae bacterium]ROS83259.1 hypothetical protein EEK90_09255 [Muribaculaceae bacterium Isolate-036 (Harlan)]RXE66183.1 hypothetical protein ED328_13405 [Muribaculaceae bacterium Isolate-001 (NCI)]GFI38450.1 cell division protein FtsZ [Muribaculaceae bacterium]
MNDDKTLLDSLAVEEAIQNDESYKFPYGNYKIIGDTGEIDRIINTCGVINVDIIDITSTLSTEADNYVAVGYAEGEGCIANAFKDAVGKLPAGMESISKMLSNIWISKGVEQQGNEMSALTDLIKCMSPDIDICWGFAWDESLEGQQAKATLIAVDVKARATSVMGNLT